MKKRVKKKIRYQFVLAKEHIPFTKYPVVHQLEEMHFVDLGSTYRNRDFAHNFTHCIAESRKTQFKASMKANSFYSVLMDGSTNKGRVENELFVLLVCHLGQILLHARALTSRCRGTCSVFVRRP